MTSLGQFYPVASPVHDLDPRAKIVATAILVAGLFLVDSILGLLFVAAALVALVAASRIPARDFLRLLRPVLFIVALTVVFQTVSTVYLEAERYAELRRIVDGAGVAWISTRRYSEEETGLDGGFELEARRADEPAARLVTLMGYHGQWLEWRA